MALGPWILARVFVVSRRGRGREGTTVMSNKAIAYHRTAEHRTASIEIYGVVLQHVQSFFQVRSLSRLTALPVQTDLVAVNPKRQQQSQRQEFHPHPRPTDLTQPHPTISILLNNNYKLHLSRAYNHKRPSYPTPQTLHPAQSAQFTIYPPQ